MFKGSLVALVTPMRPDGAVDEAAFARFVEWQIAEGTEGIVPVGTTGESPTLDHREHQRVVRIAVEVAAGGEALLSPAVTRRLIGAFVSRPPDRATAPGLETLTRREREATALAARGLTNDEIAVHMVVSPLTAKTHISRAMTKLRARDRAQLVVFAYESGLVEASRPPGAPGPA